MSQPAVPLSGAWSHGEVHTSVPGQVPHTPHVALYSRPSFAQVCSGRSSTSVFTASESQPAGGAKAWAAREVNIACCRR